MPLHFWRVAIASGFWFSGLSGSAAPALALPIFAHRYGFTCQACHTTIPHLNAFGRAFAKDGFRLDEPPGRAFPIAVKVNVAYSSEAEPGLPKAVVDEVEFLTGGTIGKRGNYFLEHYALDGGRRGHTRDAWVQYNAGNAHVRAGQFTLPLPVDPETQRDTQAHYLLYDQTAGSNGFNFFDARTGIDAYVATSAIEAHLATFGNAAMGSLARTFRNGLGLYAYRYQGQGLYRQGYGAGTALKKFNVIAVVQHGNDAGVSSSGGFLEAHYTFSPALMAVARYDRTWDALAGEQYQTVLSIVTRPYRNMRFTVEDQITDHHTLNMGWLFAY